MKLFDSLFEAARGPELDLPAAVRETYGPLDLADTVLYANFVSSLDGVVAFEPAVTESAGRLISGGEPADRYLMGLLRACADAILVGAGTARDEAEHVWTPERAAPSAAEDFAAARSRLGLTARPEVFIATASGLLDPGSPGVRTSTVLTTRRGSEVLPAAARDRAVVLSESDHLDLTGVVAWLREQGHRRVLTEGGPRLLGGLLGARLVDELFLTLAPVVAGRDGPGRPGFVEGARLLPEAGDRTRLLSLRRAGDMLFLRYALHG